jgi:hypothetical protein
MRTIISIAFALSAIALSSCAPAPVDPDVACRPRTITLNHVRHSSIAITHPTVDMCLGRTLTIRVRPSVAGAESAPGPENAGASWLKAVASEGGGQIVITVPSSGLEPGAEFQYTLTIPGVGVLDPTIRIIP